MTDQRGLVWRAYWPMAVLAATFLTVVLLFVAYINGRQHAADARAERQRGAICAILANIPGRLPPEIVNARVVFARPGHPGDCQPIIRHMPRPAVTPTPAPTSVPTVMPVRPQPARTDAARPSVRPSATRSPRHSPSPTPAPSRTCIVTICP